MMITNDELKQLIEEYLAVEAEIQEINLLPNPTTVEKSNFYTIAEYLKYENKIKEATELHYKKTTYKESVLRNIEVLKIRLIKFLPASNTWFITDGEEYAIAHRSNNWPMDNGELLIVKKPKVAELKEVTHQIIN